MSAVGIGLLGCGHVGAALVNLLDEQRDSIKQRTGLDIQIKQIAVRSTVKDRGIGAAAELMVTDPAAVVNNPDVDIIVEVIGGIEPARALLLDALKAQKPVVTANKELLANYGAELFAAADDAEVDLLFEAAVAGAIPIIRPLRESLAGEPIQRVTGIVNGTTNYILSQMAERGVSYSDALSEAQSLGYAERDPTADVEGYDAAAKAAIIATVAFGAQVVAGDVYHEGISAITERDIELAERLGFVIKAIATAEQETEQGIGQEIAVRVHPAMVPTSHPLASVRDSFNAVFVEGAASGELMFYGRGAGGRPTASAVLGDVIDAAINLNSGGRGRIGQLAPAKIKPIDDLRCAYYIGLEVADQTGVLAEVAEIFGKHNVSIRSMDQHGLGTDASLVFITHVCTERDVQATLSDLRQLDSVHMIGAMIRVIGDN